MMRFWLAMGALNGLVAVVMSAVVAHGGFEPPRENALRWALDNHRTHALALLAVAWLSTRAHRPAARRLVALAGTGFLAGCLLFSGTLYVVAITLTPALAKIAPFGGGAFMVGWLALFVGGVWAFAGHGNATPRSNGGGRLSGP